MKYLATDFLDSLANYSDDLQRSDGIVSSEVLLVEEQSLKDLEYCTIPLDLIVLTEDPGTIPVAGRHHVIRAVYKYNKVSRLFCEIFDKRHRVRLFLSTTFKNESDEREEKYRIKHARDLRSLFSEHGIPEKEDGFQKILKLANSPYRDIVSYYQFSDSLLEERDFLAEGDHFLYSSPYDILDPPIETIKHLVMEQSKYDMVDIISYGIKGSLDGELLQISDQAIVFTEEDFLPMLEHLMLRHRHIIPVLPRKNKKYFAVEQLEVLNDYINTEVL